MNPIRRALAALGGLATVLALTALAAPAHAQFQPKRAVRILTPLSAGSGPDAALRALAQDLSRKWGQPVIVENRPGGNGFIAISAFKDAAADGHELIMAEGGQLTVHPHTFRKLPYDPVKDLEPVRWMLLSKFFVAVSANSPYKNIDDIVKAARLKPEGVMYGSFYTGSPPHLGALKLQSMTGTKMVHVAYKEMVQLYTAVATGEVDWALGSLASAGPIERTGRLKFIAIAGPSRFELYPNVPATSESAAARDFTVTGWNGIFAPRGTPKDIREKIANDISDVLASPQMVERYKTFGYEDPRLATDAFARQIAAETAEWKKVIAEAGLKLDE